MSARRPNSSSTLPGKRRLKYVELPALQRSRELWKRKAFKEALLSFSKISRKHPANAIALLETARAYSARFEFVQAKKYIDHLLKLGGADPHTLFQVGQCYRMARFPSHAIQFFRKAIDARQEFGEAHLEIAVLLEQAGDAGEAMDHIETVLASNPDSSNAQLVKARILRRMDDAKAAGTILRELVSTSRTHPLLRAEGWSLIARGLHEEGRFDEAFDAVLQGRAFQEKVAKPHREAMEGDRETLLKLRDSLTKKIVARWSGPGVIGSTKAAFLTGPAGSGTSRLAEGNPAMPIISRREVFRSCVFPELITSALDESRKLDAALLDRMAPEVIEDERDRYFDTLRTVQKLEDESVSDESDEGESSWLIDQNPGQTLHLPGWHRLVPGGTILYMLRDPREMVLECLFHHRALNAFSSQLLNVDSIADHIVTELETWQILKKCLPAESWREISFESIKANPSALLADLDPSWQLKAPKDAQDKMKADPASKFRWQDYESHLAPVIPKLEPWI